MFIHVAYIFQVCSNACFFYFRDLLRTDLRSSAGILSNTHNSGLIRRLIHKLPFFLGVKWKVLYGSFSHDSEPYAFCETDPYCPNPRCMYQMKAEKRGLIFKRYYWKCDRCDEYYECPTKDPIDASETIERMLEADIRSGRAKLRED